ncbi:hypothetical protein VIBNISOn1_p0050 [Vibrio nigripulchritudo SOn1]|uniref:Transposase n=1 Tax=Vibrio nigripulchritudo SOn1 TaxID=1238450 RepID=A0AAV2VZZ7_9VIBR|nr:hypothetical protein VIBNISOn1_p0050 [Vibrio nigripulchritudo SOn1]
MLFKGRTDRQRVRWRVGKGNSHTSLAIVILVEFWRDRYLYIRTKASLYNGVKDNKSIMYDAPLEQISRSPLAVCGLKGAVF